MEKLIGQYNFKTIKTDDFYSILTEAGYLSNTVMHFLNGHLMGGNTITWKQLLFSAQFLLRPFICQVLGI